MESLPSHFRGDGHFPRDYRRRLRHGSAEDRRTVIAEIQATFPAKSIGEFFELVAHTYGDRIAMHEERYGKRGEQVGERRQLTYQELNEAIKDRARELLRWGVKKGDRVGMIAENSIDSFIFKYACERIGAVVVPWTEREEESGMTTVEAMEKVHPSFIGVQGDRAPNHLLKARGVPEYPHVSALLQERKLIGISPTDRFQVEKEIGSPVAVSPTDTLEDRERSVGLSDIALLMYSSGTGGMTPKLVEVSHGNLLYHYFVDPYVLQQPVGGRDLHILPQYHIFGEVVSGSALSMGAELIVSDIQSLKGGGKRFFQQGQFHSFLGVPDIWVKMREGIEEGLRKRIEPFHAAKGIVQKIRMGIRALIPGIILTTLEEDIVEIAEHDITKAKETRNPHLLDKTIRFWSAIYSGSENPLPALDVQEVVLRKIESVVHALGRMFEVPIENGREGDSGTSDDQKKQSSLIARMGRPVRRWIGHRLYAVVRKQAGLNDFRFGISGGSALPARDRAFLEALGKPADRLHLGTGYGLTECTAICTIPFQDDKDLAAMAGRVVPGTVAWTQNNPDGLPEICIAGPGVARYLDPEAQKQLIPDEVLHTGDIGAVYDVIWDTREQISSFVHISGRIKRMVKWKGVSILPEPIELLLKECSLIEEVMITGDGQSHLGAVILPSYEGVRRHCEEHPIAGFDPAHPDWNHAGIRAAFQRELKNRTKMDCIKQRVKIDSLLLVNNIPAECWTLSRKLRVPVIEKHFHKELQAMWLEARRKEKREQQK